MVPVSSRIIQLSDTHLFADSEQSLLGVNTQQSFQAVIDLLQQDKNKIDFIIHTGDITQDYSEAAYIRLADKLKPFNVPIYCVPGNHDDPKVMAKIYPRDMISDRRHIVLKHWQIILLDSHKSGSVAGYLDSAQLNYLNHCLQAYPELHAIVTFHHHPMSVGSRWLDNIGLINANEFWQVIAHYPNVHTVLFGHVHQIFEKKVKGTQCYSAPSTCIQFKRKQDHFGLEKLPPGFRWLQLYEEGRLETGVKRVAEYVGQFDENTKGY